MRWRAAISAFWRLMPDAPTAISFPSRSRPRSDVSEGTETPSAAANPHLGRPSIKGTIEEISEKRRFGR